MTGPPAPRGFAALTPEPRAELGARGGCKAHELGTAHQWSVSEAHEAGRRGGRKTKKKKRDETQEEDHHDESSDQQRARAK
jgi:general stress protein YciG